MRIMHRHVRRQCEDSPEVACDFLRNSWFGGSFICHVVSRARDHALTGD